MFFAKRWLTPVVMALLLLSACGYDGDYEEEESAYEDEGEDWEEEVNEEEATAFPEEEPAPSLDAGDKWGLWVNGTHLRGANIWQRHVYPELDGPEFMGPGPLGPPYTQEDVNRLAALGANYVNISHPGLFTETPPYSVDQDAQDNLDQLLDMIARADMFAVISFRTGPGRSEFTFVLEDVGDWFDESYLNDTVWEDAEAQDGWVEMWRYTAERYRHNPIVVGYDLMVEPNVNETHFDIWDPEEFYAASAGTTTDWNQLYPRITKAVREVDQDTPILVAAMAYSAVEWLPYLEPTGDSHTIYTIHPYAPIEYTHQTPGPLGGLKLTYPGEIYGQPFNRDWLDDLLTPVDEFMAEHGVPVAANEFGSMRFEPGAAQYMDDLMGLFEERGINHALWVFAPSWAPYLEEPQPFHFPLGTDLDNRTEVVSSDLLDVIKKYWSLNTERPSNMK